MEKDERLWSVSIDQIVPSISEEVTRVVSAVVKGYISTYLLR